MKSEHEDDGLLSAWMKHDAAFPDNNLESKIMARIIPRPAPVRNAVKIPHVVIVVGYCMLACAAVVACVCNVEVLADMQLFTSSSQPFPGDGFSQYYGAVIGAVAVAALSFVAYAWQSRKGTQV